MEKQISAMRKINTILQTLDNPHEKLRVLKFLYDNVCQEQYTGKLMVDQPPTIADVLHTNEQIG